MSSEKQYLELFREQRSLLDAPAPACLNARRDEAACLLERHGLPGRKAERYKYTDVEAALAPDYGLNLRRLRAQADPYDAYRCNVPGLRTDLFYVLNDTPCPARQEPAPGNGHAVVLPFSAAARECPGLLEKFYHRAAGRTYDAITALNTLLVQDGLLVYVPAGVKAATPVQIVNMSDAARPMMSNRRVLVVLEEGSEAAVLFCDHAEAGRAALSTQVVEVYAAPSARLDLYAVEETHDGFTRFNNLYVEQQERSNVTINSVVLNNGLSRSLSDIRLLGPHAAVSICGAAVADRRKRVDSNILVEHAAPFGASRMLCKYVLDDSATGAFAGRVLVHEGAQKTVSEQTNANLCASPDAHAYAQPMLEIYADDVKCNHGSTVGKLDEQALLYMRQRGIEEKEARLLLQHAFINDVLQHVGIDCLRARLSHLVEMRFRGELSKCRDCKMCHR